MIKEVKFDSEILGMRVGYIPALTEMSIEEDLRNTNFDYIYTKVDPARLNIINTLVDNGFKFVEVLFEYMRKLYDPCFYPTIVSPAKESDLPELFDLSDNYFYLSRYHIDPKINDVRAKLLYKTWIKNSVKGIYGNGVLILRDPKTKSIEGFSSFRLDNSIGYIDLTAISTKGTELNGREYLTNAVLDSLIMGGANLAMTSTQSTNTSSIRMLESTHFNHVKTYITLVKYG